MAYLDTYISKRFEFKYFLDPIKATKIENFLRQAVDLTPDLHSKKDAYCVNSLYFDTPLMGDYRDKDGSFLVRKKVRARMYETCWNDGLEKVWLEVKHKRNMNISKKRVGISGELWKSFITYNDPHILISAENQVSEEDKDDLLHFAHTYMRGHYRPVAVVRYYRKAYLTKFTSPIRITFDYDVQTSRFEDAHMPHNLTPVSHNAVIMEVKFNDKLPWWFKHMLTHFNLQRTDFSKYRNSLAVMRGYQRIAINK